MSSRAYKVQQLNEEFFPRGPGSLKITPEFIQRLQEYGFITTKEADNLGALQNTASEQTESLDELSSAIEALSERLKQEEGNEDLVGLLARSRAIINNLDGSKPSSLTANIKAVSSELTAYLSSGEVAQLTPQEKESLQELNLALRIADRMNPKNISSAKLSSYLSFA